MMHIHRHRLCPAYMKHQHHQKAHGVKMLKGIEREPPSVLRSIVPKAVSRIAVAQFMESDAQKRRNKAQQDAEDI